MKIIYKYPLPKDGKLVIPKEAQILTIREQGEDVFLWALVETKKASDERTLLVFGTGHVIADDLNIEYLDTFFVSNGKFVFHVFEKLEN